VHETVNGKRYLVLHGHQFDLVTRTAPWIAKLGDRGYEFTIWVNRIVNRIRRRMGLRYWSLSKFIKLKVKKATMIIGRFEESALHYAREHGYDGITYRNVVEKVDWEKGGSAYIAFDPTQIKSATGNRGTFDPNDPNITRGLVGGAGAAAETQRD